MMKTNDIPDDLMKRFPELEICRSALLSAFEILTESFSAGRKLLICGNGGSSADADHITGELMKGFLLKRSLPQSDIDRFTGMFPEDGTFIANHLQRALPALSLTSQTALISAFANDVCPEMVFAQQVYALGVPGDVLLGISSSGNSLNVCNAAKVAKVIGLRTVCLTGGDGGKLAKLCDVSMIAPAHETYRVQEYHLPIYHALCAMLEYEFFDI